MFTEYFKIIPNILKWAGWGVSILLCLILIKGYSHYTDLIEQNQNLIANQKFQIENSKLAIKELQKANMLNEKSIIDKNNEISKIQNDFQEKIKELKDVLHNDKASKDWSAIPIPDAIIDRLRAE